MNDTARFYDKCMPEPNTGCWLWFAATDCNGYGRIKWGDRVDGAHRVSWMIHCGEIPDGLFVLHRCDVKPCVNPEHLFLGDNSQNMLDYIAKGGVLCAHDKRGALNGRALLTSEAVLRIRDLLARGSTQMAVAAQFSISQAQVSRVARRVAWGHV